MRILSIGQTIHHPPLEITSILESELASHPKLHHYDYVVIHGGDGSIRRITKTLHQSSFNGSVILNPTGSFNVIAKLHRVPKLDKVLTTLTAGKKPQTSPQPYYTLNDEVFLFSAGNMGDLQHIMLSETLRFGILKKGMGKYILALLFLLPLHLLMTPFMLMSKRKFFIFTPLSLIKKFGSFYGKIERLKIDLDNHYNLIELDGDIVMIEQSSLTIAQAGTLTLVTACSQRAAHNTPKHACPPE